MALTDDTKDELKGMVTTIRERLTQEFTEQLQGLYGIQPSGAVTDVEDLGIVDEQQRTVAEQLRESIDHYAGGAEAPKKARKEAIQRTIREQAFTILNRFAALRLAEERDFIAESVGSGFESAGFRVYDRVAGSDVGETTYERYRVYLECLFDELSRDLGVLFDRYAPEGLLFPREEALDDVLDALTDEAVDAAWTEDETIGWIYQYFHPKSERKAMRSESQQPRDSQEMAVRNQLFTPRYVVEFLVDNSLGRYWHEMTQGDTDLTADLDYFVPRDNEVFLGEGDDPPQDADDDLYVAPHRPMKDPSEIRLLDPACGSMHFGLYAFDLFEKIYAEAWDQDPDLRQSLQDDLGLEDGDREAFLREVPRLIVENNLYGVDIDRRAAQIAGLALWLRAQRAWSEQGVAPADRPRIRQSGIVCAEPMPGDEDLLDAYVETLEEKGPEGRLLGDLVREIWERMQIAGEAGPLLKVEREIEDVLEAARRQFEEQQERMRRKEGKQGVMFHDLKEAEQGELQFDVSGVEASFFEQAEELLLEALQDFAAESSEGTEYGRRLFADDAERGFDFLDLIHRGATTGFDVVVMNPPFGDVSKGAKEYVDIQYPSTKADVYQAFVERSEDLLVPAGQLGAITSRTGFFLTSSQDFRERIVLEKFHPQLFADFGHGVLDALVETAAFVLRSRTEKERKARVSEVLDDLVNVETSGKGKFSVPKYMEARGFNPQSTIDRPIAEKELHALERRGYIRDESSHYTQYRHDHERISETRSHTYERLPRPSIFCYRLLDEENRADVLNQIVDEARPRFLMSAASISNVPESPFAYWVTDGVRETFEKFPAFGDSQRTAKQGLATADDFRFVRLWWEVPTDEHCSPDHHPDIWAGPYCVSSDVRWLPFAKGGAFSPYYSDVLLLVDWKEDGKALRNFVDPKTGRQRSRPQSTSYYFQPGLTWTNSTTSRFSVRALPRGCVFSHMGQSAFFRGVRKEVHNALGIMNSDPFVGIMSIMLGLAEAGRKHYEVGTVKRVPFPEDDSLRIRELALDGNRIKKKLSSRSTTAKLYQVPSVLRGERSNLSGSLKKEAERVTNLREELGSLQDEIDEEAYDLYGLAGEDRDSVELSLNQQSIGTDSHDSSSDGEVEEVLDTPALVHDLLSYIVGVCFGRFDVRYATGERDLPEVPGPFDALPVSSPGMLTDADGLPLEKAPNGYPVEFPESGILTDGTPQSLSERVRSVLELIYGPDTAATVEYEAMDILGEDQLEDYLSNPNRFFDDHKSQYSKSRRRAPIYWPLQTPSGQYTLWIYYPRLSAETLYTCVNEYLDPKLDNQVRPELDRLRTEISDGNPDARENFDRLTTLEEELVAMREELLRVAELPYEPNQNDGVELTAAPLHTLFQHTSWSDRLEGYWEELKDGEYDWAHIAYSIWPERVEDACREDKSIAIAHGKEELYEE
jgi:hypothetical protein